MPELKHPNNENICRIFGQFTRDKLSSVIDENIISESYELGKLTQQLGDSLGGMFSSEDHIYEFTDKIRDLENVKSYINKLDKIC